MRIDVWQYCVEIKDYSARISTASLRSKHHITELRVGLIRT